MFSVLHFVGQNKTQELHTRSFVIWQLGRTQDSNKGFLHRTILTCFNHILARQSFFPFADHGSYDHCHDSAEDHSENGAKDDGGDLQIPVVRNVRHLNRFTHNNRYLLTNRFYRQAVFRIVRWVLKLRHGVHYAEVRRLLRIGFDSSPTFIRVQTVCISPQTRSQFKMVVWMAR